MKNRQYGFSLFEVMVATLIISVGVMGFFKLNQLSIKRNQHAKIYFRASLAASSLVEMLKASPGFANWLISTKNGNIAITEGQRNYQLQCNAINQEPTDSSHWCVAGGNAIHQHLFNRLQVLFSNHFNYAINKAVMCLRNSPNAVGQSIRVTVVWKNTYQNAEGKNTFSDIQASSDCPASYNAPLPNKVPANPTQSEVAYIDIYSSI